MLFKVIEDFQSSNKLKVDSLMRPGGPTESTINRRLAEQDDRRPTHGGGRYGLGGVPAERPSLLSPANAPRAPGYGPRQPLPLMPRFGAELGLGSGANHGGGRATQPLTAPRLGPAPAKRDLAPRLPPLPPYREHRPDPRANTETFPEERDEQPQSLVRVKSRPQAKEDFILSTPNLSRELLAGMILDNRRGNDRTQADNERIARLVEKIASANGWDFKHTYGSQDPNGVRLPEKHLPSGNGTLKGGAHLDLVLRVNGRDIALNTVSTWKNGKVPTADELRAAQKIIDLLESGGLLSDPVFEIVPKSKHWASQQEYDEYVEQVLRRRLLQELRKPAP